MKRSPLKTKPNREKAAARFARQFHSKEFVEWMQAKPCVCGDCDWTPWTRGEVSHVKSRGAGGTWKDTVPMSRICHRLFHDQGRRTYCQDLSWPLERLSELAAGYAREWGQISQGAAEAGETTGPVPSPGEGAREA